MLEKEQEYCWSYLLLGSSLVENISITRSGVRTHADIRPLELKSNALTTRPSWWFYMKIYSLWIQSCAFSCKPCTKNWRIYIEFSCIFQSRCSKTLKILNYDNAWKKNQFRFNDCLRINFLRLSTIGLRNFVQRLSWRLCIVGSVVEFSPATRETGVRFPDNANNFTSKVKIAR